MELTRTAEPQINFAVVDLGSNTIRMTLYDVQEQGGFQALFSEKRMAGLVNSIRSGSLTREGIEVACSVLRGFQRLLAQFGPVPVHVFATASLRNIRNTEEVLAAIRENTGLEVEVLSGELEARYGCIGAMLTCPLAGGAVFDIGGGSTEIVRLENGKIVSAQSLDIGSLNLYNRYVSELWPSRPEIDELTSAVRKKLRKADLPKKPSPFICGIGGTARAVLKIANQYLEKPESNRLLTVAEHEHRVEYDKRRVVWHGAKDRRLMDIADHGKDEVNKINAFKTARETTISQMKEIEEKRQLAKKECERLDALLNQLPSAPDLSENQEYIALVDEIRKKEEAMMQIDDGTEFRKEIQQKRRFIQSELDSVNAEFFKVSKNTELEHRIKFLREEHMKKEQAKSDCQKILSLLDALDKKKNELLVDDINSHFGGRVTWDLFAFAKNGGYKKDYCEPCIDGYLVKDTANKGRRIEAKMIIALSIQKIVGIQCPIILDDAESLDSWRLPVCDSQLIVLRREDNREMEVQTA